MWEIDTKLQLINLLYAAVLGGFYCLFYDVFRAIRMTVKCSATAVFIQDIIFWGMLAPVTFCFLMVSTNGQVRGYIIIGIVIGFFLVRSTVSFILIKIYSLLLKGLFWIISLILKVKNSVSGYFSRIFGNFMMIIQKNTKKAINTLKKLLKKQ